MNLAKDKYSHVATRNGQSYLIRVTARPAISHRKFYKCGHFAEISGFTLSINALESAIISIGQSCPTCTIKKLAKRLSWCPRCESLVLRESIVQAGDSRGYVWSIIVTCTLDYEIELLRFTVNRKPFVCNHFADPAVQLDI